MAPKKDDDPPSPDGNGGASDDLRMDVASEMLRRLASGESPASAFVQVDDALAAARAFLKSKGVDHVSQLAEADRDELREIAAAGLRILKKKREGGLFE